MSSSIPTLSTPPGDASTTYHIPCFSGELWTIPTSNSTMRLLVTGNETNNAFAVVGTGGTFDQPIGFHYHNEAHDVFLCLKGTLNVWANGKARSLGPGDFASVPPATIHAYQITSPHTEFLGLIIPGGWEAFFRFIGEPFSSSPPLPNHLPHTLIPRPLFPTHDPRPFHQVPPPKLIAAAEKFDMVPIQDGRPHFPPQPWDGTENALPGACTAGGYFLKADCGPRWVVGAALVRPLVGRAESEGKFSVYSIEGSAAGRERGLGVEGLVLRFAGTHHALQVVDGVVEVVVEEQRVSVGVGETVFVPAGKAWRIGAESVWAKWYVFANGGGIGEVMVGVGVPYEWAVVPQVEDAQAWDTSKLAGLEKELDFVVV